MFIVAPVASEAASPLALPLGIGSLDPVQLGMFVAAAAGLTMVMVSTYRRQQRSARSETPTVRQRYDDSRRQTSAKRELEQVMLELDQLARQVHGRLDTKLARLEIVIRDADARIERLSRLMRSAQGGDSVDATLESEAPRAASETPAEPERTHGDVCRLADQGRSPSQIAREVGKPVGEVELILALRKTKAAAETVAAGRQPGSTSAP